MAEITREFKDGNMVVSRDGEEVRTVTPEQLQERLDSIDGRIAKITERRTEVQDWKDQAEASA